MDPSERSSSSIGFIGAGNMAQAMCKGFITAGLIEANQLLLSDPVESQLIQIQTLGVRSTTSNTEVVKQCKIIILAVKPNLVKPVLQEIRQHVDKNHLFISIAAGINIASIEEELPVGTRVIRVMPNTPALVQCAASAFAKGSHADSSDAETTRRLLSSLGIVEEVLEKHLDAVCGLSGSGPAYMFMALEALSDGGVKMGLDRNLALRLAAQTMMGAAKMYLETGRHPGLLKDAVCSPAGTTIAAVSALEKSAFRSSLISAVEAATLRSCELGSADKSH